MKKGKITIIKPSTLSLNPSPLPMGSKLINKMEKFINLHDGATAFITGCKDDSGCDHQWDGDGLITFGNGETFKESEYRKILDTLTTEEQVKEWHKGKGTTMGECTCSKCGVPYTAINNPHYL